MVSTSPTEELGRGLAWLQLQRSAMESLLRDLVEINSFTENEDGVRACGERLAEWLAPLPLAISLVPSGGRFAPHLVATTAAPGPRHMLVGHLDTVFPPGTFEGYRSDGARAYGPGVLDMKGGLVVTAFALGALAEMGQLANLPLAFVAVSDEEVGSPQSQALLGEIAAAQGAASALVFESGRPDDSIVTRRKGTGGVTVRASGRAAHAGNAHAEGRNAIWALARFVDAAQRLTDYARGVTVNVGRIDGGEAKNTVPEAARAAVDLRFCDRAAGEALVAALDQAARAAERDVPGTKLTLQGGLSRSPLERSAGSGALLEAYGACAAAVGLGSAEAELQGGGSDANTLAALGVPAIDGLGPRGDGYHTKREYIELATLVPKAEAVVRLLGSG